jgi:hypothetical protein
MVGGALIPYDCEIMPDKRIFYFDEIFVAQFLLSFPRKRESILLT